MKKGVEMTLNTMIIAIILLIVAAIIIAIFTGGIRDLVPWFKASSSCDGQGNTCYATSNECSGQVIKSGCPNDKPFCCLREGNAKT